MDVLEAIKARRSVRKYFSTPIPEEKLQLVLNAARLAPSACNYQPWLFIVLRDEERKRKLAVACNNQKFIAQAPVVIVACGLEDESSALVGGYMVSYPIDVAIAMDHLILAATSEGLGSCWITAFSEPKVKQVLELPPEIRVVAITPLGYPAETPAPTPRKHLSEIVRYETFSGGT